MLRLARGGAAALAGWRRKLVHTSAQSYGAIGLECFESSGPPIFDGSKTLSVRAFALPEDCANRPICILARADPPNSDPLPDSLPAGSGRFRIAGVVVFSGGAEPYAGRAAFEADEAGHHMPAGSAMYTKYAGEPGASWPGPIGDVYPWHIASAVAAPATLDDAPTPALQRHFGPLFNVSLPNDMAERWPALRHACDT